VDLQLDGDGEPSSAVVEMGSASFTPADLPCVLKVSELVDQPIEAGGEQLRFTGVSVGNPHCVIFRQHGYQWSRDELLRLGPELEHHPYFPRRINVQLAVPIGPKSIFIQIWERGAGETLASGSSACAAASAAVCLGLVRGPVAVKSPGGTLHIDLDEEYNLTMRGAVAEVARGTFSGSFIKTLR
jgi:diaminopimelate epimerase